MADSDLYTAALAVYDFENNSNDTKGDYNLTAGGAPSYSDVDYKQGSYSGSLDGSDDYWYSESDDFDMAGGDYSVAFWYKTPASPGTKGIVAKMIAAQQDGWWVGTCWCGTHSRIEFANRHLTNWSGDTCFAHYALSANTWYHVCMAHDASADTSTWWISTSVHGDVCDADAQAQTKHPASAAAANFGIGITGYGDIGIGGFDEVVVWKNYVLTDDDAQALFAGDWRETGGTPVDITVSESLSVSELQP